MRSENSPNEQRQDDSAWLDFSMTTVALAGSGRVTANPSPTRFWAFSEPLAGAGQVLPTTSAGRGYFLYGLSDRKQRKLIGSGGCGGYLTVRPASAGLGSMPMQSLTAERIRCLEPR